MIWSLCPLFVFFCAQSLNCSSSHVTPIPCSSGGLKRPTLGRSCVRWLGFELVNRPVNSSKPISCLMGGLERLTHVRSRS